MSNPLRWTSADLEVLPDDGKRYEIIDGELYMSRAPRFEHQYACDRITRYLLEWNETAQAGEAMSGAGVIFADDDDVIPDVIWMSNERLEAALGEDGHFHAAPEIAIEVLSLGSANLKRDREAKLRLYSRRGVQEYWIIDWMVKQVEVYRRRQRALKIVHTLSDKDLLDSPLLPGFSCPVARLFTDLPAKKRRRKGGAV